LFFVLNKNERKSIISIQWWARHVVLRHVSCKEKDYEVHTAVANTGGFSNEDLKVIEDKAYRLEQNRM
jgi:hypothetical protein